MRALLAIATLAIATGCSLSTDYSGTEFRCDDGQGCPGGYDCRAGICVDPVAGGDPDAGPSPVTGADASPESDAGAGVLSPDGAPPPAPAAGCGTVGMLRDDFEDGVEDPRWSWSWSDSGTSRSETGGALALRIEGGAAGEPWTGYMSEFSYDLRGTEARVEVEQVGGDWTILELQLPAGDKLALMTYRGSLQATVGTDVRAEVPYDPAAHRWWRVREQGGTTHWESSADAVTWTALHTEPNPMPLHAVHLLLAAGGSLLNASEARFASLNPQADPAEHWCESASLQDDFDDNALAPEWSWSYDDHGCSYAEAGGQAVLSYTGQQNAWCGFYPGRPYDFRDSTVAVEVAQTISASNSTTGLWIEPSDWSGWIEIVREGSDLILAHANDAAYIIVDRIPYDATAHRWWRLREAAGTTHWETSPDGATWTTRASAPTPLDLAEVFPSLGGGTWSGGLASPAVARFDNLNR